MFAVTFNIEGPQAVEMEIDRMVGFFGIFSDGLSSVVGERRREEAQSFKKNVTLAFLRRAAAYRCL